MSTEAIRERFLAQVPSLDSIPDDWEGLLFFTVATTLGELCVLAENADAAQEATVIHFGRACAATVKCDDDGAPHTSIVPRSWLGPCQYLDSILVLHGDPCKPAMRGPDSAPALSPGASFADAANAHTHALPREDVRELDARDEWLRKRGLRS